MVHLSTLSVAFTTLLAFTAAHPGHDVQEEALERRAALQHFSKRSLSHCSAHAKARGVEAKALLRRSRWASQLRRRRVLEHKPLYRRSLNSTLSTDHHSNRSCLAVTTDPTEIFTDNNASCVLQPDVTQGPYYVAGELFRSDVRENQTGVTLYADIQFLDMDTCEPVPDMYMDFWHCNATGVYAGVIANGNGNSNDSSNLNSTFLRGVQRTDSDGVLQVTSVFPGHYTGRATHIHLLAHSVTATINSNGTIASNSTSAHHVGQLFFDQSLIAAVDTIYPYSTNTQPLTENADDSILATEAGSSDPFMQYVLLGDSVSDGILAWISIGVNMSAAAVYSVSPAATLTNHGGVENANGQMDGPGENGTMPMGSGMPPGGSPPGGSPPPMKH